VTEQIVGGEPREPGGDGGLEELRGRGPQQAQPALGKRGELAPVEARQVRGS
jgi:hypothetical protein